MFAFIRSFQCLCLDTFSSMALNVLLSTGPLAAAKKSFKLLSGFLAKDSLPRVSRKSRLSANGNGDNEMIPWTMYRFPGICLTAEEKLGKY